MRKVGLLRNTTNMFPANIIYPNITAQFIVRGQVETKRPETEKNHPHFI